MKSTPETASRVPLGIQVGYGSAEVGLNAVETILRLYLLIFYTDVVGLRPGLAGLAVALGLLWDAVTDPVMGAVSDRTRHRWGGRGIYVLAGGVLLAFGAVAVFTPPALGSQGGRFAWLLASYCALNTALTVISIPYLALGSELASDPHERSVIFGWRFAFANAGALMAAALPVTMAGETSNGTGGIEAMGPVSMIIAITVVVGAIIAWLATRRAAVIAAPSRAERTTAQRSAIGRSLLRRLIARLLIPMRNPSFRPLLVAYIVATIGIGMNAAVALYYYLYRLELTNDDVRVLLVVFMGVFTLSIAGWVRLSRRFGKLPPLVVGACALGASTSVLYVMLPPGQLVYPLVLGAVGIGSLVGCIVLIESLLTDVIDHDRVRTRRHRAGLYFGVWRFASKIARAAAVAGTGFVLDVVGFESGATQPPGVGFALALLFGPGVGAFFLAAGIVLARYRFSGEKQAQVQRVLRRRADGEGRA